MDQYLPLPQAGRLDETGKLKFFDTRLENDKVRFAAYRLSLKGTRAKGSVTILAGETTAKRTKLADETLLTVLLPMIVVVALLIYAAAWRSI